MSGTGLWHILEKLLIGKNGASPVGIVKANGTDGLVVRNGDDSADGALKVGTLEISGGIAGNPALNELNITVNGNFDHWRKGTSFAAAADNTKTADQWWWRTTGSGAVTIQQSTTVPDSRLSQWSLQVDVTTADASLAATDRYNIEHRIEGIAARQLINGGTLRFAVRSPKAGIHCVAFTNTGAAGVPDRSYVVEYTVAAADTWQVVTIPIPALVNAGTWNYGRGVTGLRIVFALAAGSNFQTTAGSWQTGNYLCTASQVNCMDNTANNFFISQVQYSPAAILPAYTPLDPVIDEARATMYLQKSYNRTTAPGTNGAPGYVAVLAVANNLAVPMKQPNAMAGTPSVSVYSRTGTASKLSTIAAADIGTTIGWGSISENGGGLVTDSGTGLTAGTVYYGHFVWEVNLV